MSPTKRLKCTCKHEFQDREYGPGVRLHNITKKTSGTMPIYRCTVCKAERTAK